MNQREFATPKGTTLPLMDIKGKPYLQVQHRIIWFREEHPDWTILTEIVSTNEKETRAKAIIQTPEGRTVSTGNKYESRAGFADHLEKAESGAIGRALGFLGYGTAFALDLEEGDRLADAPTTEVEKKSPMKTTGTPSSLGDYVVTFGKYKDKTIKFVAESEGPQKVSSYIQWLENDAKVKNKALSQGAQDLIEAFDAFVSEKEIDESMPKETLEEKMSRLKTQHPGVPGKPMPKAYKDSDDAPPWDPNEEFPA